MLPVLRLGPLTLQTPGLVLLVSFAVAALLAEREARRLGLPEAPVSNGIFLGLLAGLLGARLVYAARYLSAYLASPASLLALNASALAVAEGVIIGSLAALFYWWVKDLPLRRVLDAIAPLLAVLGAGLGLAHLAAGSAYGAATRVPWAIYLWDDYRHPSQVYEVLAAALILLILARARRAAAFAGFQFSLVITLSAAARLFLETFRGDSTAFVGGLRAAQLAACAVLWLGLWLMGRWARS